MTAETLRAENEELRIRLEEAEETIRAIQLGAVDALVVQEPTGHRVYTLEAADRPYRLFVEQMQQGAATLHADGIIAYCNQRLADLLKVPHERMIGALLHEFVVTDDLAAYDSLLSQGRTQSGRGEVRLRQATGERLPVHLTFNVLPNDSGAAIGVLVTDLTAQRHHENLAAALERLRVSEESLLQADRRKDEFLATLAHELRGPLAPLSNMLQVMKHVDRDVGQIQRASDMMERQVSQLVRLVDDLLDVSRITRNKLELRKERVDLASVITQAVEDCHPLCAQHNQTITVTLPQETVYLDADPVRLAQVFNNLLNNACKYTGAGGHITLTAELQPDFVVVTLKDTGMGIPPDKLATVFDLFMQVDQSLERTSGGLGIGLTLVRRLVEMHDGTVEARSEGAGRGSEFVVRLPVLTPKTMVEMPAASAGATPATVARRILVVDDNYDSAESLAMLLSLGGNDTRIVHDGLAAVASADEFRPDIVFLDIGLPKLNGFDAARRIRNESWGQDMVLVALTGWGQDADRQKSRDAGFDAHMVKPVDYNEVLKLLVQAGANARRRVQVR